mmetsp:Transcript_19745/g.56766  ORF Transcript_19745/g.56766 Transcript_19745/m.56766 type:complete len:151 (-) Transcript_19745:148-600(-)
MGDVEDAVEWLWLWRWRCLLLLSPMPLYEARVVNLAGADADASCAFSAAAEPAAATQDELQQQMTIAATSARNNGSHGLTIILLISLLFRSALIVLKCVTLLSDTATVVNHDLCIPISSSPIWLSLLSSLLMTLCLPSSIGFSARRLSIA